MKQKLSFDVSDVYVVDPSANLCMVADEADKDDSKKNEGAAESSNLCIVCFSEKKQTLLLPCRHYCMCETCAQGVKYHGQGRCPICREQVSRYVLLDETD